MPDLESPAVQQALVLLRSMSKDELSEVLDRICQHCRDLNERAHPDGGECYGHPAYDV